MARMNTIRLLVKCPSRRIQKNNRPCDLTLKKEPVCQARKIEYKISIFYSLNGFRPG